MEKRDDSHDKAMSQSDRTADVDQDSSTTAGKNHQVEDVALDLKDESAASGSAQDLNAEEMKQLYDPDFGWYVVRVASNRENTVLEVISARAKIANMEDYFGQILVPAENVVEMRSGKKRQIKRKFFPGYILVQMKMTDESWHFLRQLPNILGFLGGEQNKPVPIPAKEVEGIVRREQGVAKHPRSTHVFEVGEVIRISDGPFADFNGVVEEVNYDKSRLVVSVLIFGRSTPVDLEFSQVEKSS